MRAFSQGKERGYDPCLGGGWVGGVDTLWGEGAGPRPPGITTQVGSAPSGPAGELAALQVHRRKIRLIEYNAKCWYLKKYTCKGTFRQVFYLSEAHSPPMTLYSPPFPLTHCIRVYSFLIQTGKGGGES